MLLFALRRILGLVPVVLIVLTGSFFLAKLLPGGPFDRDKEVPVEVRRNLEAKYHLDQPAWRQYLFYLSDLARGDLGPSTKYKDRSVGEIVAQTFPVTLELALFAMLLSLVTGIGAGLWAALRQNRWQDHTAMSLALLGLSIPNFVLGPVLILVFSIALQLFPPARWGGLSHLILPGITLSAIYSATLARMTRAGMLEVLRQDYIRTARAKGLPERLVVLRHALRAGLLPVVTYAGPALAGLFTGSLVVEQIFGVPGMGPFFVEAATNRDVGLALGVVLVDAVFLLAANLLVDLAYGFLDPRIGLGA